jgi:hypothetical protein
MELTALPELPVPNSAIIKSGACVVVSEHSFELLEIDAPKQELSTYGSVSEDKMDIDRRGEDEESLEGILT